jgi:transcriptional regulator with XRE-family HTH domain
MTMKTIDITTYRINKLLKENGWSQVELAQKLDVTQQTVQKWVKGKSSPSMDNIDKLVGLTGYPPHWFMLAPDDESSGSPATPALKDDERRLLELFREFPSVESQNMLLVFEMRLMELKKHYYKYFEARDGKPK